MWHHTGQRATPKEYCDKGCRSQLAKEIDDKRRKIDAKKMGETVDLIEVSEWSETIEKEIAIANKHVEALDMCLRLRGINSIAKTPFPILIK